MSNLAMLFTEADLGAPMSDSIAVKSNEKFGSSTVGLNCGFFSGCTLYPPFTPGCPPKSKIPKIAGPVWRNKCSRKFVRYQKKHVWPKLHGYISKNTPGILDQVPHLEATARCRILFIFHDFGRSFCVQWCDDVSTSNDVALAVLVSPIPYLYRKKNRVSIEAFVSVYGVRLNS